HPSSEQTTTRTTARTCPVTRRTCSISIRTTRPIGSRSWLPTARRPSRLTAMSTAASRTCKRRQRAGRSRTRRP
ncbi:hypothetical protein MCOR17_010038, partial [Pyricularia oryzae]